ncbi:MAG: hypothetical protein WC791_02990 [Candidatus Paceibacterota bacterium]|jgi:hypothetical protein
MLRTIKFGMILGAVALFANTAEAASLFFVPQTGSYTIGQDISVDLKIDTEGAGINAAQATIRFPKDTLQVKSVDKTNSTFNFWLAEPTFSNTDGVISFVGGTPYGVSGASLSVIHIVFTSKGSGVAPVTIVDAAVTASDGSGTNILSKTSNANYTISPTTTNPTAVVPTATTPGVATTTSSTPLVVTPPVQIVRTPAVASGLPIKPILNVPLYSDPSIWSNNSNIFNVSWILPADVTGVATAINKQPGFTPSINEGLFDNKTFPALAEGVWYLHVQFKNQIGWGPVAHYRIAIDTAPPQPFTITSSEGAQSDNPTPTLSFNASDALSGISGYRTRVDNDSWTPIDIKGFKGSYQLPPQTPSKHTLTIQAIDNAGNSIENTLDYEILPIASPTFTFVTPNLFSDQQAGLSIRGTGIPSTEILLAIKKGAAVMQSTTVPVDADGNWSFTSSQILLSGTYVASIQNKDTRGALSLPVTSSKISVSGRYTYLTIGLFVILFVGILLGGWFYRARRERTALRIKVASSDTAKVFKMIGDDVQKLQDAQKTHSDLNAEFLADKIQKNVNKMGGYVKDEIDHAKD